MTNAQHMLWMLDEYETITSSRNPGFITGKPIEMGGSQGHKEATGYKTNGLLDVHIITNEDIKNKTSYAVKIDAITDTARSLTIGNGSVENWYDTVFTNPTITWPGAYSIISSGSLVLSQFTKPKIRTIKTNIFWILNNSLNNYLITVVTPILCIAPIAPIELNA